MPSWNGQELHHFYLFVVEFAPSVKGNKNLQMKTLEILVITHDFQITCAAFWSFWSICKG
jgi:hypothetical protein